MSAVNWTLVKNAIHAWLVGSTGLSAERVMFGGQNAVRPKGIDSAWISIWIMGDEKTGIANVQYIDNPSPSPGAELIKRVNGQSLVTMQVTCFGPRNATDSTEAYAYISDAVADVDLDEVSDPLVAAGVGLQQFSPVNTVGGMINTTRIEPRAAVTITFLTPTVRERTMTFIETVNTQVQLDGPGPVKVFDFQFDIGD